MFNEFGTKQSIRGKRGLSVDMLTGKPQLHFYLMCSNFVLLTFEYLE
jgi:hypothetical protein